MQKCKVLTDDARELQVYVGQQDTKPRIEKNGNDIKDKVKGK